MKALIVEEVAKAEFKISWAIADGSALSFRFGVKPVCIGQMMLKLTFGSSLKHGVNGGMLG